MASSAEPLEVLEEVFRFVAGSPLDTISLLIDAASDPAHPIWPALQEQLSMVSEEAATEARADRRALGLARGLPEWTADRKARLWVLYVSLWLEVPRRRLESIARQGEVGRPAPYDHPALLDLEVGPDFLVPLSEFRVQFSVLERNGHCFTMLPAVQSTNAQYWFLQGLQSEGLCQATRVRLDPFLHGPTGEYQPMVYKMLWYGRTLEWDRLGGLKEEDHGRWLPETLSTPCEFTDYVWAPRGPEVHFRCEELPLVTEIDVRGSRYLHAIYLPQGQKIGHLDGAVRVYREDDWHKRRELHVRNAGKVGNRVKVFQVGAPMPPDVFARLVPSYFVWNSDVCRYFRGETA